MRNDKNEPDGRSMIDLDELSQVLEEEDRIFESLVRTITRQHPQARPEESTREFFGLFHQEVETFTEDDSESIDVGGLREVVDDQEGSR